MNSILRSILVGILAVFLGLILGGLLNMSIILSSGYIIALPEGVDSSDVNSIRDNIHLFQAKHYVMPFLAHSLGTLLGAFIAGSIAYSLDKKHITWVLAAAAVGILFMLGGIETSKDINAPITPTLVDALLAYIPFSVLGALMVSRKKTETLD